MARQIPEEVIEEIRKSNDIVDVIGEYVQLKKQGRNYFGLCPFHGEKTPSFQLHKINKYFIVLGAEKVVMLLLLLWRWKIILLLKP